MDIDNDINPGVTPAGDDAPQEEHAASEGSDQPVDAPSDTSPAVEDKAAPQVTERGTKVAREPESRYYQQLKNENADMRRLLGDPAALREYLREAEGTHAPTDGRQDEIGQLVEQATLPNGQVDAHKLAQLMDERVTRKIDEGMRYLSQNMSRSQQLGRAYDEDKQAIRAEHPELDPRQKDRFDPDLEQMIGERFLAQGGLEGKVSLRQVVDDTFAYLAKLQGKATAQAETEVVRKRAGAIPTQTVSGQSQDEEANMSPEQILASRVRQSIQKRA